MPSIYEDNRQSLIKAYTLDNIYDWLVLLFPLRFVICLL